MLLKGQSGFTLVEAIIVLVIVGILSAYATMNNGNSSAYTLLSQAETMASDLRHVQALATTWGRSLQVSVVAGTSGSYSVSCVTTGVSAPCNASPVIDPATGSPFRVSLQQSAAITGPALLQIDSLGKPSAAATYVLSAGGVSKSVTVAALTGFVSVP